MDQFVDVYAKDTGKKHRIPPHWLDHPVLGKPFRKTPKTRAADGPEPDAATSVDATPIPPSSTDTPA
jgi:hypothetical protein